MRLVQMYFLIKTLWLRQGTLQTAAASLGWREEEEVEGEEEEGPG